MFQEASGELSWDEGDVAETSYTWSFNEFLNQFSELYSWLSSIQEAVYGKEENVIDRSLRVVSIICLFLIYLTTLFIFWDCSMSDDAMISVKLIGMYVEGSYILCLVSQDHHNEPTAMTVPQNLSDMKQEC